MRKPNPDRILKLVRAGLWLGMLAQVACSSRSATLAPLVVLTPLSAQPTAVQELFQQSNGGDPRTPGYWLLWNTCAEGNKAETAKANGGREAGWIIMDDLLADPGILVGALEVTTCQQGIDLLQMKDNARSDHGNDPAYTLASQLLAAQLNLAAGAASCPAAEEAVRGAQLLLVSLNFDGTQIYLGPPVASQDRETAMILADQLSQYNTGGLCVP